MGDTHNREDKRERYTCPWSMVLNIGCIPHGVCPMPPTVRVLWVIPIGKYMMIPFVNSTRDHPIPVFSILWARNASLALPIAAISISWWGGVRGSGRQMDLETSGDDPETSGAYLIENFTLITTPFGRKLRGWTDSHDGWGGSRHSTTWTGGGGTRRHLWSNRRRTGKGRDIRNEEEEEEDVGNHMGGESISWCSVCAVSVVLCHDHHVLSWMGNMETRGTGGGTGVNV